MELILLILGIIALFLVVLGNKKFFVDPARNRQYALEQPNYILLYEYKGGIKAQRKLKVSLANNNEAVLKFCFSQINGYQEFFSATSKNGIVVIDTYFGKKGSTFIVLADRPIDGTIEILPEDSKETPIATLQAYVWQ